LYVLRENKPREVICTLVTDGEGNFRAVDENGRVLGIFTKSQVIHGAQGFQRSNDFLLQDQSAKLLPKERVCNCLKKRIDKQKQREVKYNENRKKLTMRMFSVVALYGRVQFAPSKLPKNVGKNSKRA
jgi:hypothetical protein